MAGACPKCGIELRAGAGGVQVCATCGVWHPRLVQAHPTCVSSERMTCPVCDALLSTELATPTQVFFRCPASHGTFVPQEALALNPEKVFAQFKEEIEGTLGSDARAHYHLAQAYREMGLLADAVKTLDDLLALDPSWPNAAMMRAELIEELRNR